MRRVQLYPEPPKLAVELERPSPALTSDCRDCTLGARARSVCIRAEGKPGDIFIVSDYPGSQEDSSGRPFQGETGYFLRRLIKDYCADRPVVLDNAIKCAAAGGDTEAAVAACRKHLALVFQQAQPKRILAMGRHAILGVTGRSLPPFHVRRGYAWTSTGVPVFFFMNPVNALRNRFVRNWFEADFKWAVNATPPIPPMFNAVTNMVETSEDAELACAELRKSPWFAFDCEWAGTPFSAYQTVDLSIFAKDSTEGWTWDIDALRSNAVKAPLAKLMLDASVKKVGQWIQRDTLAVLMELGVEVRGIHSDVRLRRKLLTDDADANLELMAELVGMGGHKEEMQDEQEKARLVVRRYGKENISAQAALFPRDSNGLRGDVIASIRPECEADQFSYGFLPPLIRARYCGRDALATANLETVLSQRFTEEPPAITKMWNAVVRPAADAIRHVEAWGVKIDQTAIDNFAKYLLGLKAEVEARINQHARAAGMKREFRDSSQYVGELLFKRLKLPPAHMTKSGKEPSTDEEALEKIKHRHPAVLDIVEYRRLAKLDGTYATGMKKHIRGDGRIHPSILLDGTRTGRPSCQSPNCQNIPRDKDSAEGKMARDVFVASDGWSLLEFDYNQLELRVAAMLSRDPAMLQIFREGGDFHRRTAEFIAPIVWGIKECKNALCGKPFHPWCGVEDKHRTGAKTFNFGVIYGMSIGGIAERAHCSVAEAQKIQDAILGKFKLLATWIEESLRYAKKHGECWTWWDGENARRRSLWQIADDDGLARSVAEHSSWNTKVQGTGSEYLVASLVETVNWVRDDAVPARVCLPVHDSLLLEVRDDAIDETAYQVHRIMTSHRADGVAITADIKIGNAWGSMKKFDMKRIAA